MRIENLKKHKNIWLFALLLLSLLATYWFEERGNVLKQITDSRSSEIFNPSDVSELKSVKGLKINIDREGERFFSHENHLPLSKLRLDELFTILGNLKIKSVISEEDLKKVGRGYYIADDALKLTFFYNRGEVTFSLGNKLPYDQTFYFEVIKNGKAQMVIASDESPDPGVYQNDKDYQRSEAKYKRLQMLFMLTNLYFYDTRVFKDMYGDESKIHFSKVEVLTFRNKKFELDFEKTQTNPPIPKGISYFEDNWLAFHKVLTHLEGRTAYAPYESSALSEILSQVEILDREGRKITLQVYKKFGELNGYFMTSSLDKVLYALKPEDARYFFVNVQDFWKKTLPPTAKDYELTITFYDGKNEKVKIEDKQLFKVHPQNAQQKVRELEFKKLIDFIKMEGDHVSELSEKPSDILKKNVLRLNFENRALSVILEDNDAVVVDLENKLKIHHYIGATVPFGIKRADYFE